MTCVISRAACAPTRSTTPTHQVEAKASNPQKRIKGRQQVGRARAAEAPWWPQCALQPAAAWHEPKEKLASTWC